MPGGEEGRSGYFIHFLILYQVGNARVNLRRQIQGGF